MRVPRILLTLLFAVAVVFAAPALAQEHPAPPPPAHGASPVAKGAEPVQEHETGDEEGNPVVEAIARLLNFAILAGGLGYLLRSPIAAYLSSRSTAIRQDLVTASDMRAAATSQLAEIDRKMQALPAELEALRRQGAEDVKSEQARIARAAETERERLLEQTRREIDMRLRIARRELTELAAQLAVQVAEQRIRRTITPDDQIRLVDRYASQLKEAR